MRLFFHKDLYAFFLLQCYKASFPIEKKNKKLTTVTILPGQIQLALKVC